LTQALLEMPRTNVRGIRESSTKRTWRCYYDDETEAAVLSMYCLDFSRFGYDEKLERHPGCSPGPETGLCSSQMKWEEEEEKEKVEKQKEVEEKEDEEEEEKKEG